jgi:TetR/AcrR family transcriptional regulator
MGKKSDVTRTKLIETARALFLEKGFDGLKMQELADRAKMNKGLLHYYFKTKDALFQAIFKEAMQDLFGGVVKELVSNHPVEIKMHSVVDLYFDKLKANPGLPLFVLSEVHRNPSLKSLVGITDIIPILMGAVSNQIKPAEEKIKFLNLVLSVVSLCVFPFAAQPLISKILPGSIKFDDFIEQRRDYIKNIATHLIEEL